MVTISSGLKDIGRGLFTARQFIYKGGGFTAVKQLSKHKEKGGGKSVLWSCSGETAVFLLGYVLLCLDNNTVFFLCQSVVIRIVVYLHKIYLYFCRSSRSYCFIGAQYNSSPAGCCYIKASLYWRKLRSHSNAQRFPCIWACSFFSSSNSCRELQT